MGTQKHLGKALFMSTHDICFYGEIRKNIPELSLNIPVLRSLWKRVVGTD